MYEEETVTRWIPHAVDFWHVLNKASAICSSPFFLNEWHEKQQQKKLSQKHHRIERNLFFHHFYDVPFTLFPWCGSRGKSLKLRFHYVPSSFRWFCSLIFIAHQCMTLVFIADCVTVCMCSFMRHKMNVEGKKKDKKSFFNGKHWHNKKFEGDKKNKAEKKEIRSSRCLVCLQSFSFFISLRCVY